MKELLIIITVGLGLLSLAGTLFYSIHSRRTSGLKQAIYRAWMNIFMGLLYLAISGHLALFQLPALGYVMVAAIAFLGLINLYYGWKNRRYYTDLWTERLSHVDSKK